MRPSASSQTDLVIDSRPTQRAGEELQVALSPFKGRDYVNVRKWHRGADGGLLPGKGLTVPVSDLPWLRLALAKAEQEALRAGMLDEEAFELCGLPLPPELLGEA